MSVDRGSGAHEPAEQGLRDTAPRPTLRDVALLAGVSTKTASRVVNGESGVSDEKVAAVGRAIRQLRYRPNFTASSLRRSGGRTKAIAAILEDVANPFSAAVQRALEDSARTEGVLIIAGSIDEDPDRERELVSAFTTRRVDALVIAPATRDQSYLAPELASGTPIVFIDRPPVGIAADAVIADNRAGAVSAVEHLADHGHRRIAYLGDLQGIATAQLRFDGYAVALQARGLSVDPAIVIHDVHSEAAALDATLRLMDSPDPPTALFTAQNNVTIGTIRAIHRRGLQHRVALVGFDDVPLGDVLSPGITVVAQNPTAVGRTAAEIVFRRLAGDTTSPVTHVIPCSLITRGSGEITR